jgi:hypothetical protein
VRAESRARCREPFVVLVVVHVADEVHRRGVRTGDSDAGRQAWDWDSERGGPAR